MRLVIIFFILFQGSVAIAQNEQSLPESTPTPETPESVTSDADMEEDLSLHYPSIDSMFTLYLHIQYVNMLAESLLHYDERTQAIRIGVSIVR
jgi:hypothetical protein